MDEHERDLGGVSLKGRRIGCHIDICISIVSW